jgi:hypothetical protein
VAVFREHGNAYKICGSHGGGYEEFYLLGYDAVEI